MLCTIHGYMPLSASKLTGKVVFSIQLVPVLNVHWSINQIYMGTCIGGV